MAEPIDRTVSYRDSHDVVGELAPPEHDDIDVDRSAPMTVRARLDLPGGTRYGCLITDCEWHHDDRGPTGEQQWRGSIEATVEGVMRDHAQAVNAVVAEHLGSHPLLAWAQEVAAQRQRAERAEAELEQLRADRAADADWIEYARELLVAVIAPACNRDNYGNCITHGGLVLISGGQCPHFLGRAFLAGSGLQPAGTTRQTDAAAEPPTEPTHEGSDPGHGGLTTHRGRRENCTAPDCLDAGQEAGDG